MPPVLLVSSVHSAASMLVKCDKKNINLSAGEFQMRRIVPAVAKNEASLLERLVQEYKKFKSANPRKTARLPTGIKQMARDVHSGGVSPDAMAKALGLSKPGLQRWLEESKSASKKRKGKSTPLAFASGQPMPDVVKAEDVIIPLTASAIPQTSALPHDSDWIRMRVDGREIEVARRDFWALLQSRQ